MITYLEIVEEVAKGKHKRLKIVSKEPVKDMKEARLFVAGKHKKKYGDKKFIKQIHKHYHSPDDRRSCSVEMI